jgi:putative addiction module antidote
MCSTENIQVKLCKVGNSIGTSFPKEILDRLGLKDGDVMNLVVMDDYIKLVAHDPKFGKVMEAYRKGADQYHGAMKQLADG